MKAFFALLARDLRSNTRVGSTSSGVLFFFAIVVMLPLGVGPDGEMLGRLAPGILWIGVLLSSLSGLELMFREDWEDGSLEVMALSALPLEMIVLAKCFGHWLANLLPLAVLSIPFGLLLQLNVSEALVVGGVMLAGTPAFSFLGGIGSVLTLDVRRGGILALLLVLPLQLPALIFGVLASSGGVGSTGSLFLGFGVSLGLLAVVPFLAGAVLWARLRL